ncbi:hypothetical protein BH11PSE8_BH11PSE8_12220 [soil metagenome]
MPEVNARSGWQGTMILTQSPLNRGLRSRIPLYGNDSSNPS